MYALMLALALGTSTWMGAVPDNHGCDVCVVPNWPGCPECLGSWKGSVPAGKYGRVSLPLPAGAYEIILSPTKGNPDLLALGRETGFACAPAKSGLGEEICKTTSAKATTLELRVYAPTGTSSFGLYVFPAPTK